MSLWVDDVFGRSPLCQSVCIGLSVTAVKALTSLADVWIHTMNPDVCCSPLVLLTSDIFDNRHFKSGVDSEVLLASSSSPDHKHGRAWPPMTQMPVLIWGQKCWVSLVQLATRGASGVGGAINQDKSSQLYLHSKLKTTIRPKGFD